MIELNKSNVKVINQKFPIPIEHKILWADVKFGRRISGLVLTNVGVFIKGSSTLVKEEDKHVMLVHTLFSNK